MPRKNPPTVEELRANQDVYFGYFIDVYTRLGRLEGTQKIIVALVSSGFIVIGTLLTVLLSALLSG